MTKHRLGRAAAIACCLTGLSVVAIPGLAARSATVIPGSVPCEALASLVLDQTAIVSAKAVAAGQFAPAAGGGRTDPSLYRSLPAFCRVESVLKPTPDSQIGVEVWLPAEGWNGKFQEVGNGGWSGSIPYPALAHRRPRVRGRQHRYGAQG